MGKPQLEVVAATGWQTLVYKIDRDVWPVYHYHPEFDILLSLKDHKGTFVSGDHVGPLKKGTLILNGPNIPHAVLSGVPDENDWDRPAMAVIHFSRESLGDELLQRPEMGNIRDFVREARYGFEFYGATRGRAEAMMLAMREQHEFDRFLQFLQLLQLLALSDERRVLASAAYSPSLREQDISRIDRVIRFLHQSWDRELRLEEVAKVAELGEKSFCRFFKANTGKTLVEYVNEIRVGEACRLLVESELSITDIAFSVGFNNLSNFNRRFRECKNMSPRDYRAAILIDRKRQQDPLPEIRVFD